MKKNAPVLIRQMKYYLIVCFKILHYFSDIVVFYLLSLKKKVRLMACTRYNSKSSFFQNAPLFLAFGADAIHGYEKSFWTISLMVFVIH